MLPRLVSRRPVRDERGQVVALLAVSLIALLGMAALVMDVGFSWYAKRQLQSQVDAAALAAAQELPDQTTASSLAQRYAAQNPAPAGVSENAALVSYSRMQGTRRNAPVNKVTVEETGRIPSLFGGVLGLNGFGYDVKGDACSPCGNRDFDVVLVVDRTGSMCQDPSGNPSCVDIDNAKAGMHALFDAMDAKLDEIGLVAFPPLANASTSVCSAPENGYDDPRFSFLTDPLRSDYQLADGGPATASPLYLHTAIGDASACIRAGGGTSYSQALQAGVDELEHDGRPTAQKVIIFMTDGAANTGPVWDCTDPRFSGTAGCVTHAPGNVENAQPCQAALDVAAAAKAQGISVYSIGYGIATSMPDDTCWRGMWPDAGGQPSTTPQAGTAWDSGHFGGQSCYGWWQRGRTASYASCQESPVLSTRTTLTGIASDPSQFFDAAAGDVTPVFQAIASDIENGRSHLVDDAS